MRLQRFSKAFQESFIGRNIGKLRGKPQETGISVN
jgi:hypothetical protein